MKQHLNLGLLLSFLIGSAACSSATATPETAGQPQNVRAESHAALGHDAGGKTAPVEAKKSTGSVAGTYKYDTLKGKREGYYSTLDITEKDGKLSVYVSGEYIYPVNETEQTFKSAEGGGQGKLNGDTANIEMIDENDATCHATIKFAPNQATLKVSDACHFNIVLNGVYKKVEAKTEKNDTEEQANLRQIPYGKLLEFVNDEKALKLGEQYVITKVAATKLQKKIPAAKDGADYKDLFFLEENDDDGYIGNQILVSQEMLDSLAASAKAKAATLRMQAILAETRDRERDELYRMSFVTKIEGLDKTGKVLWTAESASPEKIEFTHKH